MMNNIEFISAGAGSGKTYKLTETLAQALESGTARPHAILATTFTVKAATELRERARSWLLEKGRIDLATAIGQARLGTVNSVCGQMLKRFCFELGLSPDQTVLGEGQSKRLLKATLAESMEADAQTELDRLTERFGIEQADWSKTVEAVVKAALDNDIGPDELRVMGSQNADAMLTNWPTPATGVDPTEALATALAEAYRGVAAYVEQQQAADVKVADNLLKGLEGLQKLDRLFREGRWSWPDWIGAAGFDAGAKVRDIVAPVKSAAQAHESHPAFHAEVRQYLDHVFNLPYAKWNEDDRKLVAGTLGRKKSQQPGVDYGLFGSMGASGTFANLVIEAPTDLSHALDFIPLMGAVTQGDYDRYCKEFRAAFDQDGRVGGLPTATRLLAMKRPDTFVCIDSANRKDLCENFGVSPSTTNLENYWQRIIEPMQGDPWWRHPQPSNAADAEIWLGRAALLDAIYYTPR